MRLRSRHLPRVRSQRAVTGEKYINIVVTDLNPCYILVSQRGGRKRPRKIMFDKVEAFYRPGNVREALRLLQSGKGQARVLAGGTDVVVEGDDSVRFLIDITHAGLSYIRRRGAASVIGATTTMADLEESEMARTLAGGLLSRAARTCGSVPIRNLATLGGNMANGSPAADMATPLLVLDAAVVMVDARGRQQIAAGGISRARAAPANIPSRCWWKLWSPIRRMGKAAAGRSRNSAARRWISRWSMWRRDCNWIPAAG